MSCRITDNTNIIIFNNNSGVLKINQINPHRRSAFSPFCLTNIDVPDESAKEFRGRCMNTGTECTNVVPGLISYIQTPISYTRKRELSKT